MLTVVWIFPLQPGLEDTLNARDMVISRTLSATGDSSSPIITYLGTGDLPLCVNYQKSLLQKHKPCRLDPCSMNGIHQPKVDLVTTQFYAMSEYWYTYSDLGITLSFAYDFDNFYTSALVCFKLFFLLPTKRFAVMSGAHCYMFDALYKQLVAIGWN